MVIDIEYEINIYEKIFKDISRENSLLFPISFLEFENSIIERIYNFRLDNTIANFNNLSKNKIDVIELIRSDYSNINKLNYARNQVALLKNSIQFYHNFINSDENIRPILLYYSLINYYSFFQGVFFSYNARRDGHGLSIIGIPRNHSKPKFDSIKIKIHKNGFFSRMVKALTILGFPSIFSKSYLCIDKVGKMELVSSTSPYSIDTSPEISITDLGSHGSFIDFNHLMDEEIKKMVINSKNIPVDNTNKILNYNNTSRRLLRLISLFAGSSLARYYPYIWEDAMKAEKTNFYILLKSIYSNYKYSLRLIEEIFRIFDQIIFIDSNDYFQTSN